MSTNREELRENIRLMMRLSGDVVPTAEIHECINKLEDTLMKRAETLEKEKKNPDTDEVLNFYTKVVKCLWVASFAEDKLQRMMRRLQRETSMGLMYKELYEKEAAELRKYEVIADLIADDELGTYIEQTRKALDLKRTKSNPIS